MKKRGMKIGSFVLCLVMLLSMAVVGASAADKVDVEQKDLDALQTKVAALLKKVEDFKGASTVQGKIANLPGYTLDSLTKFDAAVKAATAKAPNATDSQVERDYLYNAINNAMNDLVPGINQYQAAQVIGLVEDIRSLDVANHTDACWAQRVKDALAGAAILGVSTNFIGNETPLQSDILKIASNLSEAKAREAISFLRSAVGPCDCNVTTTTTTTVVDDTTTTTAAPGTTTTTTAPVGAVDKSMLQALYTLNANRIENLYTEASWAKFARAMDTAKAVLDDPNATQAQVRSAFINLKIAISCLEKAPLCVSTTAAPVCTTAAPVCTTVAPATTCVPVATTCAPVATTCYPVVPTTCVPVTTTAVSPATTCAPVATTCYPVVPTTCVPVVTTTAAPAVVETTCVTVIVTPTVIVTVPVVATTAAPADIDVPDTGVESDMALLLLVASAAIVGVIILKKKVTA